MGIKKLTSQKLWELTGIIRPLPKGIQTAAVAGEIIGRQNCQCLSAELHWYSFRESLPRQGHRFW